MPSSIICLQQQGLLCSLPLNHTPRTVCSLPFGLQGSPGVTVCWVEGTALCQQDGCLCAAPHGSPCLLGLCSLQHWWFEHLRGVLWKHSSPVLCSPWVFFFSPNRALCKCSFTAVLFVAVPCSETVFPTRSFPACFTANPPAERHGAALGVV